MVEKIDILIFLNMIEEKTDDFGIPYSYLYGDELSKIKQCINYYYHNGGSYNGL